MTDFWLLSVISFGLSLLCAVHILLNMHDDTERAVSWLIAVFLFPFFGPLTYLCWGISRRNTFGVRVKEAAEEISGAGAAYASIAARNRAVAPFIVREYGENVSANPGFQMMCDRLFPDNPPLSGNRLHLLRDGNDAYPEMLRAIRTAKRTIHMQSFIIANDRIGRRIFKELLISARRGVHVRVIYDNFGSFGAIASRFFLRYQNKTPDFEIHAFSRANLLQPWNFQLRNHRKLLVIDGKTAFMGGLNISADNFSFNPKKQPGIHDLHAKVEGPAVAELQFNFLIDWCIASRQKPSLVFNDESSFPLPEKSGDCTVRILPTGHGFLYEGTQQCFSVAAASAKKSLWIQTPYFVPDRPFVQLLKLAAIRGVDVRLLLPAKNNHFFMKLASKSLYETLLDSGVRIFERRGNFSHAKAMVVDGEWTMFGSSNCDIRSFRLNYEIDLIASGGRFPASLCEQFLSAFSQSDEILSADNAKTSMGRRLAQSACALFTPIL